MTELTYTSVKFVLKSLNTTPWWFTIAYEPTQLSTRTA